MRGNERIESDGGTGLRSGSRDDRHITERIAVEVSVTARLSGTGIRHLQLILREQNAYAGLGSIIGLRGNVVQSLQCFEDVEHAGGIGFRAFCRA